MPQWSKNKLSNFSDHQSWPSILVELNSGDGKENLRFSFFLNEIKIIGLRKVIII